MNLVQVNQLQANKPYIIITSTSRISIKGGYSLTASYPGTSSSTDGNWELQSIYKYTTGVDRGDRRTRTYGFVAKDTILNGKQWHAGQFVKMGLKAYTMPFRVLLEFTGEEGTLQKSVDTKENVELPERMDVVIIKDTITSKPMNKAFPTTML